MSLVDSKKSISIILSIFMLLVLMNSSYFFLAILKLSIGSWLAFNACSIAIIVYLICFVFYLKTKREFLLAIPLLPLYYYGTMGLFLMPWNGSNVLAQITHIVITINVLWLLFQLLKECKFEALGKGLLFGVIVFVPVFAIVQSYTTLHMNEFIEVLKRI